MDTEKCNTCVHMDLNSKTYPCDQCINIAVDMYTKKELKVEVKKSCENCCNWKVGC